MVDEVSPGLGIEQGDRSPVVTVRDALPDERDAVVRLTLDAYAEYKDQFPPAFWAVYGPNIEQTVRNDPAAQYLLAVQAGTVIGSVLYYSPNAKPPHPDRFSAGWPEVRLLAVIPEARGQGIARMLMAECLRRARAEHAPVLQLHTMAAMQIARAMYERMGFERAPQLDFEPIEGVEVYGYTFQLEQSLHPERG